MCRNNEVDKNENVGNVVKFKDVEGKEEDKKEIRIKRSMDKELRKDLEKDGVSTFYMRLERSECYDPIATYTVEIPSKKQNTPEIKEAKQKEIENLMKYNMFEEVEYEVQERITSIWVINQKEKADGQKKNIKGRLLARGFRKTESPQSDSQTILRESLKRYFAIIANEGFDLMSIDIREAFLQAKGLDREVYLEPPKDVEKEGIIWRLKKPLYGLNDASRKFWLKVK